MRASPLLAAIVAVAAASWPQASHADSSLEYAVKAAYLTKFIPFITWPDTAFASATAPVTICLLGGEHFGNRLEQAAAAAKADRPLVVRRVAAPDPGCQLLFLDDDAAAGAALAELRGKPVVTVTDSGLKSHGVISFVIDDNHVRFDIDDAQAAEDGLAISSKLLSLAHAVRQRSQP